MTYALQDRTSPWGARQTSLTVPRQAAHTASYQQSAERTGRIHVIAQRRVHVRLGRLECCGEVSLPVAPGVLRARQVTACALQRLDSVEELGQRLVGYNGGLALDKHAIARSHGRKLHGLHPVVKQEQQPARVCKLLLQNRRHAVLIRRTSAVARCTSSTQRGW